MAPELKLELISIMSKFGDKAHIAADAFRDLVARHMHQPPPVVEAAAARPEARPGEAGAGASTDGRPASADVVAASAGGRPGAQEQPQPAASTQPPDALAAPAPVSPAAAVATPAPSAPSSQSAPASPASGRVLVRGKAGRRTARRLKERQLERQGMPELARPSLDHLVSGQWWCCIDCVSIEA